MLYPQFKAHPYTDISPLLLFPPLSREEIPFNTHRAHTNGFVFCGVSLVGIVLACSISNAPSLCAVADFTIALVCLDTIHVKISFRCC